MKKVKFETKLVAVGPKGAWTCLPIPFNVEDVFGSKARVPVVGTMNGFTFRNSVMPEGNGTHRMMVSRELQLGARARAGDTVRVTLERDDKERAFEVPPELTSALRKSKAAGRFFSGLTPSQKKDYCGWIASAKQQETRTRRVAQAIEFLLAGKKRLR
jgi:hypothetical protein